MGADKFATAWERFLSTVVSDLTERQQDSMRRVFYAGGSVVLGLLTEGLDKLTEEEALAALIDLSEEFSSFQSEPILPTPIEH